MHPDAQIHILHDWQVTLKAAHCFKVCCLTEEGLITKETPDAPAAASKPSSVQNMKLCAQQSADIGKGEEKMC